eukprot:14230759-Alexandrium_andersonii.AAC.1
MTACVTAKRSRSVASGKGGIGLAVGDTAAACHMFWWHNASMCEPTLRKSLWTGTGAHRHNNAELK